MSNKSIIIPVNNKPTKIESVQNFVIVGANGSGKSHLGAGKTHYTLSLIFYTFILHQYCLFILLIRYLSFIYNII